MKLDYRYLQNKSAELVFADAFRVCLFKIKNTRQGSAKSVISTKIAKNEN